MAANEGAAAEGANARVTAEAALASWKAHGERHQRHTDFLLILNVSTETSTMVTCGPDYCWLHSLINENGQFAYREREKTVVNVNGSERSEESFFDWRNGSFLMASFEKSMLVSQLPKPGMLEMAGSLANSIGLIPVSRLLYRVDSKLTDPPRLVLYNSELKPSAAVDMKWEDSILPGFVSPMFGSSKQFFCALAHGDDGKQVKVFSVEPFKEAGVYWMPAKYVFFYKNPDPSCITVKTQNEYGNKVGIHVLTAGQHEGKDKHLPLQGVDELLLPDPETTHCECVGAYVCWASRGADCIYIRRMGHPEDAPTTVPFGYDETADMCGSGTGKRLIAWNKSTLSVWDLGEQIVLVGSFTLQADAAGNPVLARTGS